eukprot:GHVS01054545.1.p1 GENE.GHVS01054545.1~~GHVS01054545.1.p1  ORF type:complete len:125 (-),score=48.66 GHVS01054545.1:68-442(-)
MCTQLAAATSELPLNFSLLVVVVRPPSWSYNRAAGGGGGNSVVVVVVVRLPQLPQLPSWWWWWLHKLVSRSGDEIDGGTEIVALKDDDCTPPNASHKKMPDLRSFCGDGGGVTVVYDVLFYIGQ